MSLFLIAPTSTNSDRFKVELEKQQLAFYALPRGEFLVNFTGTSKQLCDKIGITDEKTGSAVVVAISSYYGRASTDIWEWMESNWESKP